RLAVDVVAAVDYHRQQHAADDRDLARHGQRAGTTQDVVRDHAAEHAADETAQRRQGRDEAGLQDREPALLHQVDREPGQEEIGQRVDAVLADIDAEHHAVGEQLADVVPAGAAVLRLASLRRIHVDQRAALLDVVELGLVDPGMVLRLVDRLDPGDAHDDAEPTHHVEHVAPAML
ncbi:hypothetical protein NS44R_15185, partial [Mammaliicoccus sciuri]